MRSLNNKPGPTKHKESKPSKKNPTGFYLAVIGSEEHENLKGKEKASSVVANDSEGFYMTVNFSADGEGGGYVALRAQPTKEAKELAQLLPGEQVFTYGKINRGDMKDELRIGTSIYVCYRGIWGWVSRVFLE